MAVKRAQSLATPTKAPPKRNIRLEGSVAPPVRGHTVGGEAYVVLRRDARGAMHVYLLHPSSTEIHVGMVSDRDHAHAALIASCLVDTGHG